MCLFYAPTSRAGSRVFVCRAAKREILRNRVRQIGVGRSYQKRESGKIRDCRYTWMHHAVQEALTDLARGYKAVSFVTSP